MFSLVLHPSACIDKTNSTYFELKIGELEHILENTQTNFTKQLDSKIEKLESSIESLDYNLNLGNGKC